MQLLTVVLLLQASVAHPLRDDAPHHQATAEPTEARETLILTDLPHAHARALRDVIAHAQDRFPLDPVPVPGLDLLQEDVAAVETVRVGMVAEDEEVQATAVTAAMMIEVGAEVAHGVEGEDVKAG